MDRRKAMAVAGASTAVLASIAVAYAATMSVGWLGFGSRVTTRRVTNTAQVMPSTTMDAPSTTTTTAEPQVVVEQHDVYDRVVVPTAAEPAPAAPATAAENDTGDDGNRSSATASSASSSSSSSSRSSESEDHHESEDSHSGGGDD